MQNHFLILKKLKNTESAQLWVSGATVRANSVKSEENGCSIDPDGTV